MKHTLLIITALMLVVGCGSDTITLDINNLIDRNGLMYAPNDEKPYTGDVFELYEDGKNKLSGDYKYGKLDGKWILWYNNGHKGLEGVFKYGELVGKYNWWYEDVQKGEDDLFNAIKLEGSSPEKELMSRLNYLEQKQQLLEQITLLREERRELEEQHHKLLTDTTYIEELARDLHRMAQPGEKVFKTLPRSED